MNMGKKITDLSEGRAIPGESSYPVAMGDGTGVKQVKHKTLVEQLLADMEMPYDETLAMLTGTDEDGKQKIPNLQAISDWIRAKIVNSLLTTEEGFFLDARLGPVFDKRFKAVEDRVSSLNSDLANGFIRRDIPSNDANNAVDLGLYVTNTQTANANDWGVLLVFNNGVKNVSGRWVFQILLMTNGMIWHRIAINSPTFSEWKGII